MGFDIHAVTFLVAAKSAGVSFSEVATLGRQAFATDCKPLQKLFDLAGIKEDARKVVSESNGYAERFLQCLGAHDVCSIDNSPYEGAAVVHDMNQPVSDSLKNKFTCVIDGGTLEHIFDFPQAIRNCMEMIRVGGHFLGITVANNFVGHGFYQFSPELFYRIFSPENGFQTELVMVREVHPRAAWYRVVDPAAVQSRVELVNGRPTYILVIAKRIAAGGIFLRSPQQSDYSVQWRQHDGRASGMGDSIPEDSTARGRRWLLPLLRRTIKRLLGSYWAVSPFRYMSRYYEKVDEEKWVRGTNDGIT